MGIETEPMCFKQMHFCSLAAKMENDRALITTWTRWAQPGHVVEFPEAYELEFRDFKWELLKVNAVKEFPSIRFSELLAQRFTTAAIRFIEFCSSFMVYPSADSRVIIIGIREPEFEGECARCIAHDQSALHNVQWTFEITGWKLRTLQYEDSFDKPLRKF